MWPIWRLVTHEPPVASLEEIRRSWTLLDMVKANEVLDVKSEMLFIKTERSKEE